jgi:surface antigen
LPQLMRLPDLADRLRCLGLVALTMIAVILLQPLPARADSAGHDYEYKNKGCEYKYKENTYGYKEEYKCKGKNNNNKKYKYETKNGDCKYKYEESSRGYKEEYRCKAGRPLQADGGYWPKHKKRGHNVEKGAPFGIDLGNCNRKLIAAALGGATGGLVGAQIGDGRGQLAATAAGTLIGALLGLEVGRKLDEMDRACAGQVFEHAANNETIRWNSPADNTEVAITPKQGFQDVSGRYCREYQSTAMVAGKLQQTYGTACRQPDGSWKLES